MDKQPPSAPTEKTPSLWRILGWVFWVVELGGFIFLAGCAAAIGLDLSKSPILLALSLLVGLGVFGYGIKATFALTESGRHKLGTGITLMLLAVFIVFGGCLISL